MSISARIAAGVLAEVAPPTVAPTTGPTTAPTPADLTIAFAMIAIALTVAATLRVFRPRSIAGPPRLTLDMPARPLFLVTLLAGGAWLFSQVVYIRYRVARLGQRDPDFQFTAEHFTSLDFAFLSTVPFFIGLVVFIVGDRLLSRTVVERVGYDPAKLLRGLLVGAVSMLVVFPLMFGAGILLEAFYRSTGIEHPPAHDLLTAMKQVSTPARAAMIVGACVAAPLFEEMLFRGHIQTLLMRLFADGGRSGNSSGFPVILPESGAAMSYTGGVDLTAFTVADTPDRNPAAAWASVLITSLLFAVIHPLWTAPLIFLLAVCVGYAYQRTGNLWVPITIHALFNAGSTIVFLSGS